RPHVDSAAHGKRFFHAVGAEERGGPLGAHAVVAVNDHAPFAVGRELLHRGGETRQRNPFVAVDPADGEFVGFATIDQPRTCVRRQTDPPGHSPRTDFERRTRVRQRWNPVAHSTTTGVPSSTFSKNFSDMWWGMRMHPWDAA